MSKTIPQLQDDKDTIVNLTSMLADTQAELAAVRDQVQKAFAGPYMPSTRHVLLCLTPSPLTIAKYRVVQELGLSKELLVEGQ
jgi:hypothetical protein